MNKVKLLTVSENEWFLKQAQIISKLSSVLGILLPEYMSVLTNANQSKLEAHTWNSTMIIGVYIHGRLCDKHVFMFFVVSESVGGTETGV